MIRLSLLKWFGTTCGIVGALLLALNLEASGWGWVIFLGNSTAWFTVAMIQADLALALMNLTFTAINMVGVVRWLA